ncbi:molybdopterin-dependent oxidoreductase [Kineococcus sp. SYSU DK006]|uniref:molybdopterin-dependent oxidoreductase n=1 Tax=Kineococcus sp. SYSU DK006 TaxID=3383127 RepID=UPI003D7E7A28
MRTPQDEQESAATGAEGSPGPRRRPRTHRTAALCGVLAAGLTLGVGQLVAGVVSPSAAPLVVVGDAVVDRVPAWLKDVAVRTFGTSDKVVLLSTIAVLVLALAALAGVLARRRLAAGVALVAVLGGVGVLAAATRPDASALSPLPSALGAAAGAYALTLLTRRLAPAPAGAAQEQRPPRRAVLLGGVAAAGLATGGAGQALVAVRSAERSRSRVVLPAPADPAPALPAGLDPAEALASGLTTYATRTADFYRIDTALVVPDVVAEEWSLRIHGDVEREVVLGFDELLAKPLRERWITLTCVSNEVGGSYVGTARWLGYPLANLLEQAGVRGGADMLLATSVDGFTLSAPLAEATDGRDAMLVVGMNGEPLPREHGFPVRMVIPGLYGYVSACKWVTDIEVTRFAEKTAYWTDRGWAQRGPIKTASRVDVPKSFAKVRAGTVPVAGVAWAQHRGISRVEVRVDEGEWQQARVLPSASSDTWCQWVWEWNATETGNHSLQVRATDGTGAVQTDVVAAPIPDGASGYDSVSVTVV